jgi:hypothetical protein
MVLKSNNYSVQIGSYRFKPRYLHTILLHCLLH